MGFSRYALVGAAATAVHWGVLALLVEALQVDASGAAAIGALFGAALAYWGNRRFTFRSTEVHGRALPAFLCVAALGAAASAATVTLLTKRIGLHYLPSQAVATFAILIAGYGLNKRWTFAQ